MFRLGKKKFLWDVECRFKSFLAMKRISILYNFENYITLGTNN